MPFMLSKCPLRAQRFYAAHFLFAIAGGFAHSAETLTIQVAGLKQPAEILVD
jgi:hypothetical protein